MNIPRWLRWRSHADFDEEVDAHLELEVQRLLDSGLTMDEARRAARLQFGNLVAIKQLTREHDALFHLESFLTDVRQTLRDLRRSPAFTIAAVLTLAVSMGATTAIFSVADGVLLRPMPFPDPDRLVRVTLHTRPQANATVEMPFAELGFFHLLANNRTFARVGGVSIFAGTNGNDEWALTGNSAPYPLAVARMTAGAFEALGVPPQLGRFPTTAEDRPGGPTVLLLSDGLWRTAFAADPSIIGRAVRVNNVPWEVIGVMPASFRFPRPDVDVWVPFQLDPASKNVSRPSIGFIARLTPGATIESATADVERLVAGFAEIGYPVNWTQDIITGKAHVRTVKDDAVGRSRRPLLVLLGTMAFVLLIGCSNVANLFQVRAEARAIDAAVRAALGSGRRRLVRRLLIEGVIVALAGGLAGVALAYGGVRALVAIAPASLPRLDEIAINLTVLAFTAGVSLAAGVLFAILPALRTDSPRVLQALQAGRSGSAGRERHVARRGLVVAQVALALSLFVGSTLMVRSFAALSAIDPGFDPSRVLTFRVAPGATRYPDGEPLSRFYDALLAQVRAIPGVTAAGAASFLPMTGGIGGLGGPFLPTEIEDSPLEAGARAPNSVFRRVTPGYFEAMRIKVIEGRTFTDDDHQHRLGTVIISQSLKNRYWPRSSALGKKVAIVGPPARVVGVVGDVHDTAPDAPVEPVVYKPMLDARGGSTRAMAVTIRTSRDPVEVLPAVRRIIATLDPDLPLSDIQTMQTVVGASISRISFTTTVLALAAGIALFLGAVGIYGVMAYGVVQRTGEIGVRQALGANRAAVFRLILGEGLRMDGLGILAGLAASVALGRALSSLLYGVSPYDGITLALAVIVFIAVGVLASALPILRAVRTPPAAALRGD
ncbi:MAG TPA: ABC transporter permease [Vicinamibacterales bacterium]|jgi:predicted permease|nr:ABC transporter permease [Vicinamibacterales bacterium]